MPHLRIGADDWQRIWPNAGRGGPQVTGRNGYANVGKRAGRDLVANPIEACEHELQPEVCVAFWSWKGLNSTEAIPAPAAPSARSRALAALSDTDGVAIRCFKVGVAFPDEWRVYVEQLREIVRADSGELPKKPAFPEGT